MPDRRRFVCALGGLAAAPLIPAAALAQTDTFAPLIAAFTGGAPVRQGRVTVDTPTLADNGNAVPLRIVVDSAMSATDHVQRIVVLSEKNPRPVIATFHLGPRAGRAVVTTRVRLNGAQRLMAVAQLADGSFWAGSADVIVTSTACWDEG
jgi:sulfur-oxidizing protein SoxY